MRIALIVTAILVLPWVLLLVLLIRAAKRDREWIQEFDREYKKLKDPPLKSGDRFLDV